MKLEELKGKQIRKAERSMYGESIVLTFKDGSAWEFHASTSTIHNESWGTVEVNRIQ